MSLSNFTTEFHALFVIIWAFIIQNKKSDILNSLTLSLKNIHLVRFILYTHTHTHLKLCISKMVLILASIHWINNFSLNAKMGTTLRCLYQRKHFLQFSFIIFPKYMIYIQKQRNSFLMPDFLLAFVPEIVEQVTLTFVNHRIKELLQKIARRFSILKYLPAKETKIKN